MALTDIFTPSIVFSLAISLLFVGLLAIYVLQKISQQNHKISAMVDLISTFSNEQAMLRNYMQQTTMNPMQTMQTTQSTTAINVGGDSSRSISLKTTTDNVIPVSDNETNNTDDDDSSDDDDSDSDVDDDDNDDDSENEHSEKEENEEDDENDKVLDCEKEDDTEILPFDKIEVQLNTDNADFSELEILSDVELEQPTQITETDNIKVLNIDMSFEKQDEDGNDEEDVSMNYKKASVSRLRAIAVKRGLITADDSMRIKKADLVKLLEEV